MLGRGTFRTAPPACQQGATTSYYQQGASSNQQFAALPHGQGERLSLYSSSAYTPYTAGEEMHAQTPLYLVNDGVRLNKNNRPDIFRSSKEPQVLSLPSRSGRDHEDHAVTPDVHYNNMPSGAMDVERNDRIFGAANTPTWKESVSQELGRKEIKTVSQLQRALQSKIMQSCRPLAGVHALFQKLDRHRRGHIDFADLKAAVKDFNLEASDEIVHQLLRAIDSDHDGMLSLAEFVAGLKANNREGMRLHTPQMGISSRAYFRTIPFNHPFHNVMHNAPQHFFRGPDAAGDVMQPGTAWDPRM
tara:strand:+ start:148 stop:1053 length:906 start_codon:yes stop_codon:yes gene_type:complete